MNRNPKLREDLTIRKVAEGDDVAFTVCDAARNKYFRIDPYTRLVASYLDGERTLAEVSLLCQEAMPFNDFSLPVVEEAVQDLSAIGLLEDPYQKNLLILERARSRRPRLADFLHNMLVWQVGVWDPDKFLERTMGRVRWLFQPWLALAAAIGLLWCLWLVFVSRDQVSFDPGYLLFGHGGNAFQSIAFLFTVILVVGAVHEMGHAYACKNFGVPVHRMGFMLMYFSPCFFCDASHSMLIENRWHRIWVAMGGIYFESFITTSAGLVWWITSPDNPAHDLAYRVMMLGLLTGVVVNLNPLLKFDGYYVLSDVLQISELRERSLRYVRDLIARPFRGASGTAERVVGLRRRRAYLLYGVVTLIYSYTVLVCFFDWLRVTLIGAWSQTGFLIFACMVGVFVRKPVARAASHATAAARRPSRAWILWGAIVAVLLVAGLLIRTPGVVDARAHCVSAGREYVRADGPGRVAAVLVREGDHVLPHQVVAIMENDSVSAALQAAQGLARQSALDAAGAQRGADQADYREALDRQNAAIAQEAMLGEQRSRLALASRAGGIVLTPRPGDRVGARLEEGDTLLVLAHDGAPEVECDLHERDVGDVHTGVAVTIRLNADPGRKLAGRIVRVYAIPAEEDSLGKARFKALARLDNVPVGLRLGESGLAHIEVGHWNAYERVRRAWTRFVREDLWL